MSDTSPVITVTGLTKRFADVSAVDNLSFTVNSGEIFGLVGPDGAGKTTTLRMLAGVLEADEGSAVVAGFDVVSDPEPVKSHISYMPQRFGLYEDLTVEENIRFYADIFGVAAKERTERSARLLTASGMSEFRQRLAGNLSGGMKQKLALSCALIHTPKVLLLDEPTNGVDPVSRRDFWRILYSLLAEGVTILYSTAYLDEAERCHRLALLHEGRLLLCDTPENLKRQLPGDVVSVLAPDLRPVRDALLSLPGVRNVVLTGDRVNLFVDDAGRRVPEIESTLQTAGLPFDDVVSSPPTMEDLFVATVTKEEQKEEQGVAG
jgi:ABC-2 type transport system ATP-binding protein